MINGLSGLSGFSGYGAYTYTNGPNGVNGTDSPNGVNGTDSPNGVKVCQTCKNRKYQDGSNENVSFKSPTRISPQAAGGAVRAHEGEHVSNAYSKAAQNNGRVIRASVSIQTAVCPECGRTYVSGGTTSTAIKYQNEENPYVKNLKSLQAESMKGQNIDYAA